MTRAEATEREAVGPSARAVERALDPIGEWVAEGTLARAAAVVFVHGQPLAQRSWGSATDGAPLDAQTLFPFASLTKPAFATALLRLVERGEISLGARLGSVLPDVPEASRAITIAHLLTHSAGFPEHVPDVDLLERRRAPLSEYVRATLEHGPVFAPGSQVLYSNAGFLVLGALVERAIGTPAADLIERETLRTVRMSNSTMRPLTRPGARTARVELSMAREHDAASEIYNSAYFKRLGRADAGLFATLLDIARLLELYRVGGSNVLRPETARDALTSHTRGIPGRYGPYEWPSCDFGWGWEVKEAKSPHPTGSRTSARTFGHVGGAGVVAFSDPERALTVVMHACRDFSDGWAVRGAYFVRVANALVEAVDASSSPPNASVR